jgi:16S rRNA (guanine527-N7)-methyltransferase
MTVEEKYDLYEETLAARNLEMNLVAKSTIADIRRRHIADSAQLADYIPKSMMVIDLGSGAGFPAAVLAILGYNVVAIESVGKKCRFLEEVKEKLVLPNLTIIRGRVEDVLPRLLESANGGRKIDEISTLATPKKENFVFTARAFAPLTRMLDLTGKYGTQYVILKGRTARDEIAEAREKYAFEADLRRSATGDGWIVNLTTI